MNVTRQIKFKQDKQKYLEATNDFAKQFELSK